MSVNGYEIYGRDGNGLYRWGDHDREKVSERDVNDRPGGRHTVDGNIFIVDPIAADREFTGKATVVRLEGRERCQQLVRLLGGVRGLKGVSGLDLTLQPLSAETLLVCVRRDIAAMIRTLHD